MSGERPNRSGLCRFKILGRPDWELFEQLRGEFGRTAMRVEDGPRPGVSSHAQRCRLRLAQGFSKSYCVS